MAQWLSWLERRPVTAEVVGSNPIRVVWYESIRKDNSRSIYIAYQQSLADESARPCWYDNTFKILQALESKLSSAFIILKVQCIFYTRGILAQLGEHLPYKQRVTGSSPVGPISYFNNKILTKYADVAQFVTIKERSELIVG